MQHPVLQSALSGVIDSDGKGQGRTSAAEYTAAMDCCAQVLKSYTSEVSLQQHTIDDETVRRSDCRRYLEYTPCCWLYACSVRLARLRAVHV